MTQDRPGHDTDKEFSPRIFEEGGVQFYEDGLVFGAIDSTVDEAGQRILVIHEWSSHHPGLGHADRALRWLRARHDHIVANGVGELDEDGVGDTATAYWVRQHEKGLVDVLLLDDGSRLELPSPPRPRSPAPR